VFEILPPIDYNDDDVPEKKDVQHIIQKTIAKPK
jgi:hypothetical protein